MVTIEDIARLANVSPGTVDRVIHNRGRVSEKTAQRVREIIKKVNYRPNIYARGLSMAKPLRFGVLMPDTSNDVPYWDLPIRGIERARQELTGYRVLIDYYFYDNFTEDSFFNACESILEKASELNGLLIAPVLSTAAEQFVGRIPANLPYVFFDSDIPCARYLCKIEQNAFRSGVLAGKLLHVLLNKGGRLAVIKEARNSFHLNDRVRGFFTYFASLPEFEIDVYHADRRADRSALERRTEEILQQDGSVSGFFIPSACIEETARVVEKCCEHPPHKLVGYDLTESNILYLKKGIIDFLISQRPEDQGYQGIYCLYRHLVLRDKLKKNIDMPLDIYTRENIETSPAGTQEVTVA